MAAVLAPGGKVALKGTTEAANPALKGSVIKDVPHSIKLNVGTGTINATLHVRITKETAGGTLDFDFMLETASPLTAKKLVIKRDGFKGLQTDVNYRTDVIGSAAPSQAARNAAGGTIAFLFKNVAIGAAPDQATRYVFIRTNATAFQKGGKIAITVDGGKPTIVKVLAPKGS
jgi:hypothetical protein